MSIFQRTDPKERAAESEKNAAFVIALTMHGMIRKLDAAIVGGVVPRFDGVTLGLVNDLASGNRTSAYMVGEPLRSEVRAFWDGAMDLAGSYRTFPEDLQTVQDAGIPMEERRPRMILLRDFFSAMENRGLRRYNEGMI
jgi:hypothetical protein